MNILVLVVIGLMVLMLVALIVSDLASAAQAQAAVEAARAAQVAAAGQTAESAGRLVLALALLMIVVLVVVATVVYLVRRARSRRREWDDRRGEGRLYRRFEPVERDLYQRLPAGADDEVRLRMAEGIRDQMDLWVRMGGPRYAPPPVTRDSEIDRQDDDLPWSWQ